MAQLGAKVPSMTSGWKPSTPAASGAATSWPSRDGSAHMREGSRRLEGAARFSRRGRCRAAAVVMVLLLKDLENRLITIGLLASWCELAAVINRLLTAANSHQDLLVSMGPCHALLRADDGGRVMAQRGGRPAAPRTPHPYTSVTAM